MRRDVALTTLLGLYVVPLSRISASGRQLSWCYSSNEISSKKHPLKLSLCSSRRHMIMYKGRWWAGLPSRSPWETFFAINQLASQLLIEISKRRRIWFSRGVVYVVRLFCLISRSVTARTPIRRALRSMPLRRLEPCARRCRERWHSWGTFKGRKATSRVWKTKGKSSKMPAPVVAPVVMVIGLGLASNSVEVSFFNGNYSSGGDFLYSAMIVSAISMLAIAVCSCLRGFGAPSGESERDEKALPDAPTPVGGLYS